MNTTHVTKAICKRLCEVISHVKLKDKRVKTDKDFGAMLGVSASHVSKWRHGSACPTTLQLYVIATRYGISGTWLLTGDGQMFEKESGDLWRIERKLDRLLGGK